MILVKCILFILLVSLCNCSLPDKVYCANKECNGAISKAKTLLHYTNSEPGFISFKGNTDATILMKSAGAKENVWYATINGKSGFVNSDFLRESKMYVKKADLIVTDFKENNILQPEKVQQQHEVVDGTTLYSMEPETSTEPIAVPNELIHNDPNFVTTPTLQSLEQEANLQEPIENTLHLNSKTEDLPFNTPTSADQVKVEPILSKLEKNIESSGDQQSLTNLANRNDEINKDQAQYLEQNAAPSEQPNNDNPLQPNAIHIQSTVSPTFLQEEQSTPAIQKEQSPIIPQPHISQENLQFSSQQGNIPQPLAQENIPQPLAIENIPTLLVQENVPPLLVQGNIPPPLVQENVPQLLEQENIPQPLEQEITPQPLVHDNIPLPLAQDNIPQPLEQENIPLPLTQNQITPLLVQENIPPAQENIPHTLQKKDPLIFQQDNTLPITQKQIPNNDHEETISKKLQEQPTGVPVPENIDLLDKTFEQPNAKDKNYELNSSAAVILNEDTLNNENLNEPDVHIENEENTEEDPELSENFETSSDPQASNQLPEYTTNFTPKDQENLLNTDALPNPNKEILTEPNIVKKNEETLLETTTSAPSFNEENEKSFISSLYTTVADLFPTTTESPLQHLPEEPIVSIPNVNTKNENNINTADGEDEGFSVMKFIVSTYKSMYSSKTDSSFLFANPGETCLPNGYCEDGVGDQNNRLVFFLLTTASSILLFILGYYYLDNKRQDGQLVGMVNMLQRDLLCATKECQILKEELTSTKTKLSGIEDNSFGMDDMVKSLKDEIIEHQAQNDRLRNSLDDNEKLLRVSENTAMELQNTLGEVENTLSELLTERAHSEEHITDLNDKIQAFEEELISVSRDRDSYQLKFVSAESSQDEMKKQKELIIELNQLLLDAKNTIDSQKHEIIALKDCIKDVKNGVSDSVDANSLINTSEIKAQLAKALEDKSAFQAKYELEHKEKSRLDEELQSTRESLRAGTQHATEATTRLEVLGKYFQEREGELLKELSTKEAMWLSKQGESVSTVEKLETLQQEVQRFKEKCECLSRELAEQESSRRTAIAELEGRAHAAWLEARTARRDAAADRDAAAVLRRRLAAMAAPDAAPSPHRMSSPLEAGASPSLPPVPGVPPPLPPLAFLPPALLPPLPRPPPLGRLPSPHPPRYNDRRYSPDSRFSPESRYSPESIRYSPESRYSGERRRTPERRSPYSSRPRRRSRERYHEGRHSRQRVPDTETEYASDNSRRSPPRRRYSDRSGPSSGSGCSSESDK